MYMQIGELLLDRCADLQIGLTGVQRMNSALQADFCRTAIPRLAAASEDFVEGQIIGSPAQVFTQLAFGKSAELAFEVADIGVIDIAINHVADTVTIAFKPQLVCLLADIGKVVTPGGKQFGYGLLLKPLPGSCSHHR